MRTRFALGFAATAISRLTRFVLLVVLSVVAMPALGQPTAYMTTGDADFGTINMATGVFSSVGHLTATQSGLGVFNGTLYSASYHVGVGALSIVNPTNATLSTVGTTSLIYDTFGSTLSGLYVIDTSANLYSLNPSNGAATLIGPTGVAEVPGDWRNLSTNSGTLYYGEGPALYTINTSTGVGNLVGGTGGPQFGALVTLNGTLYGGEDAPFTRVDTLNPSTGAATIGPTLSGTSSNFFGLAPLPEPGSALSAIAAAIGVISLGRATGRYRRVI